MKDPAALLYIDKFIAGTMGMPADARGWYMDLILSQFDKGDLPNDIDELSGICRVRLTEASRFEQMFEQVLKPKFELNGNGRLENSTASEIIRAREKFKEKREQAGKMSYAVRYIRAKLSQDENFIAFFKKNASLDFDIKDEQVFEQVFKQNLELYINVNEDVIEDNNEGKGVQGDSAIPTKPTRRKPSISKANKHVSILFMEEDWKVYLQKHHGQEYHYTATTRKALKEIKLKLIEQVKARMERDSEVFIDEETDRYVRNAWQHILKNYDLLSPFHKGIAKVEQFNHFLPNIISDIKNRKGNATTSNNAREQDRSSGIEGLRQAAISVLSGGSKEQSSA